MRYVFADQDGWLKEWVSASTLNNLKLAARKGTGTWLYVYDDYDNLILCRDLRPWIVGYVRAVLDLKLRYRLPFPATVTNLENSAMFRLVGMAEGLELEDKFHAELMAYVQKLIAETRDHPAPKVLT